MELCKKEDCLGCFACMNACPKGAISVTHDRLGKTIPTVDANKCIYCGACTKSCPVLNESEYHITDECYAAWTKNENDRKNCASGGIGTAISRYVIDNDGVVFGTYFNDDAELIFDYADTQEQLERFKSSKYVQAYIGYSYKKVKEFLRQGRLVLFIATPCQIDGLNHYLGKKYDNLITVDIICHGAPPITYLKEHIKAKCADAKITNVTFRGENDYHLCVYSDEKLIYSMRSDMDEYFMTFQNSSINRDNCYNCNYARHERISDVTIGDFWGINREDLKEPYDGKISSIIVNTEKGKKIIGMLDKYIYMEKWDIDIAYRYNHQLNNPAVPGRYREAFAKNYEKMGFEKAVRKSGVSTAIAIKKAKDSKIAKTVKKVIKK